MASFELEGQKFHVLNGGPAHSTFSESISFFYSAEDQAEIDRLWDKLTADGGEPGQCGWLKDKFGLSWQIVPTALPSRYLSADPDREKAHRAMQAMMKMQKIIIADLDRAYAGSTKWSAEISRPASPSSRPSPRSDHVSKPVRSPP